MNRTFVSYVGENRETVMRLVEALRASGVEVWLDRDSLAPGVRWKAAVRDAIAGGEFFLACFSAAYQAHHRSYMNEELVLAVEELRQRPTTRAWFIPVLLDPCEVPDRDIGGGENLWSLQWVDLSADWDAGIDRILSVLDPASAGLRAAQRALASGSARERIRAAGRLAAMGPRARSAVPALGALLDDPNETVRASAAEALGRIGHPADDTIARLLHVLRHGDYYDSWHAAQALARLGRRAVPALLEAADYQGPGVSVHAGDHAQTALAAVRDPEAVPDLMAEARAGNGFAIEALGEIGLPAAAPAVPLLVELLQDEDSIRHWHAIEALGRLGDASVVPALAAKLNDGDAWTRAYAVTALGRIGGPDARPLVDPAVADPDARVRGAAVRAVDWPGFSGDALTVLARLLHDVDVVVRMHAAIALGRLGDLRAVPFLVEALDDDQNVVREAVSALGSLRAEAAVPALVPLLDHERHWIVRKCAREALVAIGTPEALRAARAPRPDAGRP
ncbi:HEAT repeat domain-containing protein [Kitasatospora sp. NPDC056446]|uniref:HEAT repeat domain-containing protein n=1 Tax=Kitasatospora sp. NPDC056446 TaxID=3345819 RepID=UPI0036AE87DB